MRTGGPVGRPRSVLLEPGEDIVRPHCAHQQAEPVVLSTGETVACVCITCLAPLTATWIDNQRHRAEITAHCAHDNLIDITAFGQVETDHLCNGCGAMNP